MPDASLQEICCCMGQPVAGNPTQYMMEKAFERAALDWRYLTFEVSPDQFPDAMRGFRALGFRGGNFTIPHKQAVVEFLDELTPAARLCGAVNCVHRREGRLLGDNTDGRGFLESLREIVDPANLRVVVLGAGGAARAVAVELALAEAAHITIVNRTEDKARDLVDILNRDTQADASLAVWDPPYAVTDDVQVVINATSIGLNDPQERVPIVQDSLRSDVLVADVVFNPPQTEFLREAQAQGCETLDGLGMLVRQGAIAFEIWTSIQPDQEVMREAVEEFLNV